MENKELTTIMDSQSTQIGIFDPEAQLDMAIMATKVLARVIAQKQKPVIINGEQYLEFEDWQTLGQFDGVSVRTGDVEPVEIYGVKGAKAKAFLVNNKTGEIIGGAEAYCMRDEEKWGTRPKYEWQGEGANRKRIKIGDEIVPWFQLASMAQTRAGSKALRNKEAWIAVLAGYKPTPAEEMTGNETPGQTQATTQEPIDPDHFCVAHQKNMVNGKYGWYCPTKIPNAKGEQVWCKGTKAPPIDKGQVTFPDDDKPPIEAMVPEVKTIFSQIQFKDANTLKQWWLNTKYKLHPADILHALDLNDFSLVTDLNAAHQVLLQKYPL